jgi:hypothetical protein
VATEPSGAAPLPGVRNVSSTRTESSFSSIRGGNLVPPGTGRIQAPHSKDSGTSMRSSRYVQRSGAGQHTSVLVASRCAGHTRTSPPAPISPPSCLTSCPFVGGSRRERIREFFHAGTFAYRRRRRIVFAAVTGLGLGQVVRGANTISAHGQLLLGDHADDRAHLRRRMGGCATTTRRHRRPSGSC